MGKLPTTKRVRPLTPTSHGAEVALASHLEKEPGWMVGWETEPHDEEAAPATAVPPPELVRAAVSAPEPTALRKAAKKVTVVQWTASKTPGYAKAKVGEKPRRQASS